MRPSCASARASPSGVSPPSYTEPVTTLIDEDLNSVAGDLGRRGMPSTVFRLRVDELIRMTGGRVTLVSSAPGSRMAA